MTGKQEKPARDENDRPEEDHSGVIAADARALGPSDGAMAEAAGIELGAVAGETEAGPGGAAAPGGNGAR